ncbi:hypothetical protein SDC9_18897 [bioreactor metagenome]|uniref:Uncharacterized protein n=1 Tax=bioreactor metagenome TaxID=1076179 RepID=A0A644U1I5_9ZZZZ
MLALTCAPDSRDRGKFKRKPQVLDAKGWAGPCPEDRLGRAAAQAAIRRAASLPPSCCPGEQMTEIAEYERRISFALDRIGRGVEALLARPVAEPPAPEPESDVGTEAPAALPVAEPVAEALAAAAPAGADPAELARLHEALDSEREANAQLSERVRAIREKQETTLSAMEKRLATATKALETAQSEVNRLKRANLDLAEANQALIEAGNDPAPHLINRAMQAELEALRAARAGEAAELAEILGTLAPLFATSAEEAQPGGGEDA